MTRARTASVQGTAACGHRSCQATEPTHPALSSPHEMSAACQRLSRTGAPTCPASWPGALLVRLPPWRDCSVGCHVGSQWANTSLQAMGLVLAQCRRSKLSAVTWFAQGHTPAAWMCPSACASRSQGWLSGDLPWPAVGLSAAWEFSLLPLCSSTKSVNSVQFDKSLHKREIYLMPLNLKKRKEKPALTPRIGKGQPPCGEHRVRGQQVLVGPQGPDPQKQTWASGWLSTWRGFLCPLTPCWCCSNSRGCS